VKATMPALERSRGRPVAKPTGRTATAGTHSESVTRARATDRSGRPPTTGQNWWRAPSTAVVRNPSMPTWTAASVPGAVGEPAAVPEAATRAAPKAVIPTPAAARNPSGTHGGGAAATPRGRAAAGGARGAVMTAGR